MQNDYDWTFSKELISIIVRVSDKAVVISPLFSEQMNRLNIFYSVKDGSVSARIGLIKGNETLLLKDLTGNRLDLAQLVKEICEEVIKHAK